MPVTAKNKRRTGATLALVAAIALAVLVIGVGFFLLVKMWGGGRELAHTTDAGVLNVAKAAIRYPAKDAFSFSNSDVGTNFALLGENPRNLDLMVYNRLYAQALIVALNAKDEGTAEASANAKKVWTALNDVGAYLRTNLQDSTVMGSYFLNLTGKNNVKMLGGKPVGLGDYDISYLKRGESTNVYMNPVMLATFSSPPAIPLNAAGRPSPSGQKYLSGYAPISVAMAGQTLTFSGIPVQPLDRPHLTDLTGFLWNKKDDFIQGSGSPAYPPNTLPPNAFKSCGLSREVVSGQLTNATACAIVSTMTQDYEMAIPYGYVEVKNGPSMQGPKAGLAFQDKDVFCHALAGQGISVTAGGEWFCRGSDGEIADVKNLDTSFNRIPSQALMENLDLNGQAPSNADTADLINLHDNMTNATDLIDRWNMVNRCSRPVRQFLWANNIPDRGVSRKYIRKSDGSRLAMDDGNMDNDDLSKINKGATFNCHWQVYTNNMIDPRGRNRTDLTFPCLTMLPAFKIGYNEFGTTRSADSGSGYTCLEQFKCDVMSNRSGCVNKVTVAAPQETSGMKWFEHGKEYPAPKNPYNFGEVKTPYEYLQMIDKVPTGDGCALDSTFKSLLKRCQQINPKLTGGDLTNALRSQPLPLGATFYLYVDNGRLVMRPQRPAWLVSSTRADGKTLLASETCGKPYKVLGSLVCTASGIKTDWTAGENSLVEAQSVDNDPNTDGYYPGWAWKTMPKAECRDEAVWLPSSGYNNLLGVLEFRNSCMGGGLFAQPN